MCRLGVEACGKHKGGLLAGYEPRGAREQRQSEVVQERDHPCLWAPGRNVDLILIKNGS